MEGKQAKNHEDYHKEVILKLYSDILEDDGKTHRIEDLVGKVRALAETDLNYAAKQRREQLGILPSDSAERPSGSKLSGTLVSQDKLKIRTGKQSTRLVGQASTLQPESTAN